jgi:hypothetical protein
MTNSGRARSLLCHILPTSLTRTSHTQSRGSRHAHEDSSWAGLVYTSWSTNVYWVSSQSFPGCLAVFDGIPDGCVIGYSPRARFGSRLACSSQSRHADNGVGYHRPAPERLRRGRRSVWAAVEESDRRERSVRAASKMVEPPGCSEGPNFVPNAPPAKRHLLVFWDGSSNLSPC